ncbi:MAG: hypothetical protein IJR87_01005 [Bacteroidaceae bacterium]|nr:hypothetical protein [Bacteroidaceae bacterium]
MKHSKYCFAALATAAAVCMSISACGDREKDEPEHGGPINERFYGKWVCQTKEIDVKFVIKQDGNIQGNGTLTRKKDESYVWQYRFSRSGNRIDATGTVQVKESSGMKNIYQSWTNFELSDDSTMTGGPMSGLVYVPYVEKPRQNIGPTACPDENHPHAIEMGSYWAWGETEPKEVYSKETYSLWKEEAEGIMADLGRDIAEERMMPPRPTGAGAGSCPTKTC